MKTLETSAAERRAAYLDGHNSGWKEGFWSGVLLGIVIAFALTALTACGGGGGDSAASFAYPPQQQDPNWQKGPIIVRVPEQIRKIQEASAQGDQP